MHVFGKHTEVLRSGDFTRKKTQDLPGFLFVLKGPAI